MRLLYVLIHLPEIFLLCLIGGAASLCGFDSLDEWCERQLDGL